MAGTLPGREPAAAAALRTHNSKGQKYAVAKASDIPPGTHRLVEADGRSIGVYNVDGAFYALRNVCPHQGAELCKGLTRPLIVSNEAGVFEQTREGEIVRCPWHQWEFDI
ncbi:MAG: Rieske [2Fe-2S] protein, partial [Paenibacillus sp.]|nr:Rieske [2Fe-2S] protein [Paenibacillus sp.]